MSDVMSKQIDSPEPPAPVMPQSAARVVLARAIQELDTAVAELAKVRRSRDRLTAILSQFEKTKLELAALWQQDDVVLGTWLAEAAEGLRPPPSPETTEAEQRLFALMRDSDAAQQALPDIEARIRTCVEIVEDLRCQRDDAVY